MRPVAAIALVLIFLAQLCPAELPRETITAQSRSGLFTINGPSASAKTLYFNNFIGNRPLKLDPALLAVSCEQIKDLLFTELGSNARQQLLATRQNLGLGRIFFVIHANADQPIAFSALPGTKGKSYRVDLPDEMFSSRLIETVVQILLIDLANVRNDQALVYPPVWLTDGFVAHLQSVGLETLPLQANLPVVKVKLRKESVANVREHFQERAPLTFEEMSWPEKLTRERASIFRDSAQLLVYELLHMKDGPASMRKMINNLPRYKNWQLAFLDGFSSRFNQVVDVEKWWALTLVNFTRRDPGQLWSMEESARKLTATLKIPALVYTSQTNMPRHADLTLQEVIKTWDFARQQMTLQKTIVQLKNLRLRIAPDLLSVVDDYRTTLESYFVERRPGQSDKKNALNSTSLKKSIASKLDEIDKRYASLIKKSLPTPKPLPLAAASLSPSSK
jgi:hypothetical protein